MNNIQVTLNLEVCGCGGEVKAREQSERVANILTRVVKGGGGLVVCKQVDWSKSRIQPVKNRTSDKNKELVLYDIFNHSPSNWEHCSWGIS